MNPFRRLLPSLLTLMTIVVVGTLWYSMVEGWSFLDAVYMVIITLFTVGFQEIHELSSGGRVFTILIIVAGVGTAIYAAGRVVEIIIEGEILGYRRKRKMGNKKPLYNLWFWKDRTPGGKGI